MTLVFASSNRKKAEEIRAVLPPAIEMLSLSDIGIDYEIPEPGVTLRENSYLKAKHVADVLQRQGKSHMAIVADDSGLEVQALEGAPGVYSARYAGEPRSDARNNQKLLEAMHNSTQRKARFVTVLTLIVNGQPHYFEGEVSGTIGYVASGTSGFGYDPLFIPTGYRSSFADLGPEIKNSISHRARAVASLVAFLSQRLADLPQNN